MFTESFDFGKAIGNAGIDVVKKYPRTALDIGAGIAVGYGIHCGLTHIENMSKIGSNERVGFTEIEAKYKNKNKKGGGCLVKFKMMLLIYFNFKLM